MTDLQTRAVGGLETRGGPPPLDVADIWELPEEEQIGARQADVLIHSLRFRAGERIRLAEEHVKVEKARLKSAEKGLKRAKKALRRERKALGAFIASEKEPGSMAEVLRENFPERFTNGG